MTCRRWRFAAEASFLRATAVLVWLLSMVATAPAVAQSACDTIDFPAGTEWTLCWELREREGLIIRSADYTDRSNTSRRVLHHGSIAEVHVPYHVGQPRFLDVTLSTAGLGANALDLTGPECDGVLVDPKVCREIHDRGYAWKFSDLFQIGQEVTYWISSQLGQYTYITSWTFRDDGAITSELGFTGRLQIVQPGRAYARFGSRVNPETSSPPEFGLNHMHNAYWRLDLDIAGSGADAINRITQVQHTGASPEPGANCAIAGSCYINRHTRVATEAVERLGRFKTWHQIDTETFNQDGRPIGYEVIPEGNQAWRGPSTEPWTAGDLYITRYDACELFAANNNDGAVNPGCADAAADVRAMVNGQTVDGFDVVVWYNAHFQHVTRDEDELNMPLEHIGVEIAPRSWRHVNTLQ